MTRVAITGGPGVGKTTVLAALREQGWCVVDEAARAVIAERLAKGLSPRPSPADFAREVVRRDLDASERHRFTQDWVLFDRGLIDGLGLLLEADPGAGDEVGALLEAHPFHRVGFVLPPWREIYRTDQERDQSFDDCLRIHESLLRWYERCGVELLEVPPGPVEERARFIVGQLGTRGA